MCNVFLLLAMIIAAWLYSGYISEVQEESKKEEFIRTVESMKTVSQNYLDNERGYVTDWASYISANDMNLEDALDFLRSINTNQERFVHIVDMDSYEAYSSYYPKGEEKIDTYLDYKEGGKEEDLPFGRIMEEMLKGEDDQFRILGKYRIQETQSMAVGVGAKVTLQDENGARDYLMLRIIPVDALKKAWVFPTEYSSAEIGIITNVGDYVVQSTSMRSQNFIEYIRGYNFQDDYNEGDELREKLKDTDSGILEYKNFKGTDCIWYYSSFAQGSALDILGVLNKEDTKATLDAWYIVFLICGTLLILVIIDGTYLMSMNRRLRETAKLAEQASKAKTQFLSAMSHDIRTPLNAVLGMMRIAEKRSDEPEFVTNCMEKGLQSGNQLLTLINDVLDISKIESGNMALHHEEVSLVELIQDLIEMQEQSMAEKGIELQSDYDSLPCKYVYADKTRLNQIYVNLLTNAVKYTEPGGKIILRFYEEAIPGNKDSIRLIYYLKDNGMGMTDDFQKSMYQNFTREVNTQVNRIQGTGLGLSIVKQIVDLMGGTILCESAPGQGTTFTVSIELLVAPEIKKKESGQEETGDIRGMHLLVAEDNDLNWEIFQELVAEDGITCERAVNGKECVEMLRKKPAGTYDAILMDINMPVMNGYEATREIRKSEEEAQRTIPIVAMTADAFAEDVQACLASGMNGHIAKPINLKILYSYLKKIKKGQL